MRLHAGIISLMTETPFIALNYMNKVSDFWCEFKDIPIIDIDKIKIPEIIQILANALNNSVERQKLKIIKKNLIERLSELKRILPRA